MSWEASDVNQVIEILEVNKVTYEVNVIDVSKVIEVPEIN